MNETKERNRFVLPMNAPDEEMESIKRGVLRVWYVVAALLILPAIGMTAVLLALAYWIVK